MPTLWQYRRHTPEEEDEVARIIRCECGFVAHGDNDDLVIAAIREHMRADHPDLLETVMEEDLRGLIHIE
jgi:predicted small metal-binding protein